MATTRKQSPRSQSSLAQWLVSPAKGREAAGLLLLMDSILSLLTVQTVPHINIDWVSYMQQAKNLSLGADYDYSNFVGDNGPMAYPAGHAWIYLGIYHLTGQGLDTRLAQYLAIIVYITNLGLVFRLLLRTEKIPPYVLAIISIGATRLRSLAVIHLFNDPMAILFLHAAINMFLDGRWSLGSVLYSLGVSIKMSVLLYSPALLCIYLTFLGLSGTVLQLTICASVQLLLAAPFLLSNPLAYLTAAFNFNRKFLYRDTVNFAFISRLLFSSQFFHHALLLIHISILLYSAPFWWKQLTKAANLLNLRQSRPFGTIDTNNNTEDKKKVRSPRWWTHLLMAVSVVIVRLMVSLPPFHPILVHGLFWPSLLLVLAYPVILLYNCIDGMHIFEKKEHTKKQISISARQTNQILLPLFLCNFVGVICSRSIHVQFYAWYFYSLHFLLWNTNFSTQMKLLLLSNIELSYFSIEITTILSYLFKFGSNQWMEFEDWINSSCVPFISLERDQLGYEVELEDEVPIYCRRGSMLSSLIFQTTHWLILTNLLWRMWRRREGLSS